MGLIPLISKTNGVVIADSISTTNVLDFGCGRGQDADYLRLFGYYVAKYDPYYFDHEYTEKFDFVLCTYVLNVLPLAEETGVIDKAKSYLKQGGTLYISVRNGKFKEGETSRGTYQRKVDLPCLLIKKNSSYKIYEIKNN